MRCEDRSQDHLQSLQYTLFIMRRLILEKEEIPQLQSTVISAFSCEKEVINDNYWIAGL